MARTTPTNIITNLAAGKGCFRPFISSNGNSSTAPAATSGHFRFALNMNNIGTTLPNTRVGFPTPDSTTESLLVQASTVSNAANSSLLFGRFYELGTLDLTATGDKFTHASTFTSLQRTIFGVANTPITMYPFLYVTTALTTTPAQVIFKTAAGGTGYVNQNGSNVVGTTTFIFPSATTAVQSLYLPMVEQGDCAVQDIVAIQVTTSAASGACLVLGFEPLFSNSSLVANMGTQLEGIYSGHMMNDLEPATPNSGSVTSFLGFCSITGATINQGIFISVNN